MFEEFDGRLRSPFGGIPRNWKQKGEAYHERVQIRVPPSGGSLEIGNRVILLGVIAVEGPVPPSGGSLEIGN